MPSAEYYSIHKEQYKQYQKDNRERAYYLTKKWKETHKEECSQYQKEWQQKHREQNRLAAKKKYYRYKLKTGFPLIMKYNYGKTRAVAHNLPWNISFEQYVPLLSKPCIYCGLTTLLFECGSSLDRKDCSIGYTVENVVPCCGKCNRVKSDVLTFEEMKVAMRAVLTYRGTLKLIQ